MKNKRKLLFAFIPAICLLALVSCGSNEKGERDRIVGTQDVTLEAQGSSMLITVDKLFSAISEILNTEEWLSFELQSYSSGAPQIKVIWTDNDEPNERKAQVLIKTKEDDQITLSINQKIKTEFDIIHNTPTDRPAYSPIR